MMIDDYDVSIHIVYYLKQCSICMMPRLRIAQCIFYVYNFV